MPKKRKKTNHFSIPKFFFQGRVLKSEIISCKNGKERTEVTLFDTDRNKEVLCVCWSRYNLEADEHVITKGFFLKPAEDKKIFIADYFTKVLGHVQDFYAQFGET